MDVPVLVISGLVGAGKSTVGRLAAQALQERDIPYALVDLEWLNEAWPRPADDPWNGRLASRNLAAMWANFSASGADRLIVCATVEDRSHLAWIEAAVPGAACTVAWLDAPVDLVQARVRRRQPDPDWSLAADSDLVARVDVDTVADFIVDNADRDPLEVAESMLRQVGWI